MRRLWILLLPPSCILGIVSLFSLVLHLSLCEEVLNSESSMNIIHNLNNNNNPVKSQEDNNVLIWLDHDNLIDLPVYTSNMISNSVKIMNTHPSDSVEIYSSDIICNKIDLMFVLEESLPMLVSPGETVNLPIMVIPRVEQASGNGTSDKLHQILMSFAKHQAPKEVLSSAFHVKLDTSRGDISSEWFLWRKKLNGISSIPEIEGHVSFHETQYRLFLRHARNITSANQPNVPGGGTTNKEIRILEVFPSDGHWMTIHLNRSIHGPMSVPFVSGRMQIGVITIDWDKFVATLPFELKDIEKLSNGFVIGYVHIRTNKDILIIPIEISSKDAEIFQQQQQHYQSPPEPVRTKSNMLSATPSLADFGIVFTAEPNSTNQAINITLHNLSPTLLIEVTQIDLIPSNQPEKNLWSAGFTGGLRIPPKQEVSPALMVKCSTIIPIIPTCDGSQKKNLSGVIRVYAQLSNSELISLEIPYKVMILSGTFVVQDTSFPFTHPNSTTTSSNSKIKTYSKNFVFNNTLPIPVKIHHTSISQCPIHPLTLNLSLDTYTFPNQTAVHVSMQYPYHCKNCQSSTFECIWNIYSDVVKQIQVPLKFFTQSLWVQSYGLDEKLLQKKNTIKLHIGSIFRNEIYRHELYLANMDPSKSISVVLDGLHHNQDTIDVQLGRVPCHIQDMLPIDTDERRNIVSDQQYLVNHHRNFDSLSLFSYCADLKRHASYKWKKEYERHAWVQFFRNNTIPFAGFPTDTSGRLRRNQKKKNTRSKPIEWKIPPGGMIRLDIFIYPTSSSIEDLRMQKIMGLKLFSPDTSQVFEMVIQYQSIGAKLLMSSKAEFISEDEEDEIMLDMIVRPAYGLNGTLDHKDGAKLYIASTFNKPVFLQELRVCHPWFTILPMESNSRSKLALPSSNSTLDPIATVHSSVTCTKDGHIQNFYACVLDWLTTDEYKTKNESYCKGGGEYGFDYQKMQKPRSTRDAFVVNELIPLLKEISGFISVRFPPTDEEENEEEFDVEENGSRESSIIKLLQPNLNGGPGLKIHGNFPKMSYLNSTLVKYFDLLEKVWYEFTENGFNIVETKLQAKARILTSNDDEIVDIPVYNSKISMDLAVPKFHIEDYLKFPLTQVGDVSHAYIQVKNPTSIPIKMKIGVEHLIASFHKYTSLLVDADDDVIRYVPYVHSSNKGSSWWSGGNFFLSDNDGHLIQSQHNITIKSSGGALVSLINPSLHANSAFLMGCGKRCGLRETSEPATSGSSSYPVQFDKPINPIGASAVKGSSMKGQFMGRTIHPAFAVTEKSLQEVTIAPFDEGILGPVYFRPMGRDEFECELYIENSLTGLEKVTAKGKGAFEKIIFLDGVEENDDDDETLDSFVEYRRGYPTLVFSGSASAKRGPVRKSVLVMNDGDIPVHINDVYMGTNDVKFFSNLKSHPLSNMNNRQSDKGHCESNGFLLIGCDKDSSTTSFNEPLQSIQLNASLNSLISSLLNSLQSMVLYPFNVIFRSDISYVINHSLEYELLEDIVYEDKLHHAIDENLDREYRNHTEEIIYSEANLNVDNMTSTTNNEEFLRKGFTLKPGQSKLLYIDHTADCVTTSSYTSLILEFGQKYGGSAGYSSGHGMNYAQSGKNEKDFKRRKAELLIGYDMTDEQMETCITSNASPPPFYHFFSVKPTLKVEWVLLFIVLGSYSFLWTCNRVAFVSSFCFSLSSSPKNNKQTKSVSFSSNIGIESFVPQDKNQFSLLSSQAVEEDDDEDESKMFLNKNWSTYFRIFSKGEPQSAELLALAKDQTKQLIIKFKQKQMYPPQCIHSSGDFLSRESVSNTSCNTPDIRNYPADGANFLSPSVRSQMQTSSQYMSLNETLFCNSALGSPTSSPPTLPVGLCWRTGVRLQAIPPPPSSIATLSSGLDSNFTSVLGDSSEVRKLFVKRNYGAKTMVQNNIKSSLETDEPSSSVEEIDSVLSNDTEEDKEDKGLNDDDDTYEEIGIVSDTKISNTSMLNTKKKGAPTSLYDKSKHKTESETISDSSKYSQRTQNRGKIEEPSVKGVENKNIQNEEKVESMHFLSTSPSTVSQRRSNVAVSERIPNQKFLKVAVVQQANTSKSNSTEQRSRTIKDKATSNYRQGMTSNVTPASVPQCKTLDKASKVQSNTIAQSTKVNSSYIFEPLQVTISSNRTTKVSKLKGPKVVKKQKSVVATPLSPNSLASSNNTDENHDSPTSSSPPFSDKDETSSYSPISQRSIKSDDIDSTGDLIELKANPPFLPVSIEPKGRIPSHSDPFMEESASLTPKEKLLRPPPGLAPPPGFDNDFRGSGSSLLSSPNIPSTTTLSSPHIDSSTNSEIGGHLLVAATSPFQGSSLYESSNILQQNTLNGSQNLSSSFVGDSSSFELTPSNDFNSRADQNKLEGSNPLLGLSSPPSFLLNQQHTPVQSLAVGSERKTFDIPLAGLNEEPRKPSGSALWNNDNDLRLFNQPSNNDSFNIEHFLDGILNDQGLNEDVNDNIVSAIAVEDFSAASASATLDLANNSMSTFLNHGVPTVATVSSNPRQESRAFAYGINVTPLAMPVGSIGDHDEEGNDTENNSELHEDEEEIFFNALY